MIKILPLNKINLFEFAPSISWFFLMTVPFLYQYESFNSLGRSAQFTSVFFITIFFFIIDFYCAKTNFFFFYHFVVNNIVVLNNLNVIIFTEFSKKKGLG